MTSGGEGHAHELADQRWGDVRSREALRLIQLAEKRYGFSGFERTQAAQAARMVERHEGDAA